MYQLTNNDGTDVYLEGTATEILNALIDNGVRFIDTDGLRLRVSLS